MVQPLNIRTIKSAVSGARQYVQDEKIQISRRTITKFQYAGRWPEEYNSFVGSETFRNRDKDPETFFRIMHYKPELYARKFIFRPREDSARYIREATIEAFRIVIDKTQEYISAPNYGLTPNKSTGLLASSYKVQVDGDTIRSIGQLDDLTDENITTILNVAPYSATSEKNAFVFSGIGGIFYYAAKKIARKYPQLGVRFVYLRSGDVAGTTSKYDVPSLSIGTRSNVIDRIRKPGRVHRRRQRLRRAR